MIAPFVWHYKVWLCVCVSTLFPWFTVAVWLANVHRPNSLWVTDCGLYFSVPLSLINGCSDKQTSWAKGSSSGRGGGIAESETESGGGTAYNMLLSVPCFLCHSVCAGVTLLWAIVWCVSAQSQAGVLPWGIPRCPTFTLSFHYSLFHNHYSSEQSHLQYMSCFPILSLEKA